MRSSKESLVEKEKSREDLGFGTKATSEQARLVNPDGQFNVRKLNQSFEAKSNIYHRLIRMHWLKFGVLIILFYLFVNLIFGAIYYAIGVEKLHGISQEDGLSDFWEAFFFSSQTLTTVGYGKISPAGYLTSSVAAAEAMFGLIIFSIMTGLLYGRFSRPNPKLMFSSSAIISPYLDINGLMFRIANEKHNQLMNVKVNFIFSRNETNEQGTVRRYYSLDTERSTVLFLPTAWTVVHPITKESILYGETAESLKKCDGEFIVSIEAINDTMTDPVHVRKSYLYSELNWGAKFKTMLKPVNSEYILDLSKINEVDDMELNVY